MGFKQIAGLWGGVALFAVAGCVSVPPPPDAGLMPEDRVRAHVAFLTSDAVEGRAPRSRGSKAVRRYLANVFNGLGLEPFGEAKRFEQKILPGANVVGVLRGSDPRLADEFVLVSAHHDHLGRVDGELHRGAADNAAGVAAMLEAAIRLAADPPARSVVFAAFDAEESGLLGSAYFRQRRDFDGERFAGLVNVDMLGRSTFDVMPRTLVASGTKRFPRLRAVVMGAAASEDLEVLPLGRQLIGPRSDHVWFESLDRPWVFLTCGPYRDYHKASDTADRLDFSAITSTVGVVVASVQALAEAEPPEAPVVAEADDPAETRALRSIINALLNDAAAALPPGEAEQLAAVGTELAALQDAVDAGLVSGSAAHAARRGEALLELGRVLLPRILGHSVDDAFLEFLLDVRDVYTYHPALYTDVTGWLIRRAVARKSNPFRLPGEERRFWVGGHPDMVRWEDLNEGRRRLSVSVPVLTGLVEGRWFGHGSTTYRSSWIQLDVRGDAEQIAEALMLKLWAYRGSPEESKVLVGLLSEVTGEDLGDSYDAWHVYWLERQGHADIEAWWAHVLDHASPEVAAGAVSAVFHNGGDVSGAAFGRVLTDPGRDVGLVAAVLRQLVQFGAPSFALPPLDALLDDPRPHGGRWAGDFIFDPTYPFYARGATYRKRQRRWGGGTLPGSTLGDLARVAQEAVSDVMNLIRAR